jgi:hypothetical protein
MIPLRDKFQTEMELDLFGALDILIGRGARTSSRVSEFKNGRMLKK